MLQAVDIQPHETVLEIGTGSGFITSCLAHLAEEVVSVDIHESFTENAGRRLSEQGRERAGGGPAIGRGGILGDRIARSAEPAEGMRICGPLSKCNGRLQINTSEPGADRRALGGRLLPPVGDLAGPPVFHV